MLSESKCSKRNCKYYQGIKNPTSDGEFNESKEFHYCKAFPNGIPDEIAYGDNDHTTPFDGDNGIMYEKETTETTDETEDKEAEVKALDKEIEDDQDTLDKIENKPLENSHTFRQTNPDKYESLRYAKDKGGEGIDFIFGIIKDGESEIQSIRIDATKYDYEEAKNKIEELGFTTEYGEQSAENKEVEEVEEVKDEQIEDTNKQGDGVTVTETDNTTPSVSQDETPKTEQTVTEQPLTKDEELPKEPPVELPKEELAKVVETVWTVIRDGGYLLTEEDSKIVKSITKGKVL